MIIPLIVPCPITNVKIIAFFGFRIWKILSETGPWYAIALVVLDHPAVRSPDQRLRELAPSTAKTCFEFGPSGSEYPGTSS